MMAVNSPYRERFAATLAHQPVDRSPIDLGGTPQSTVEDPATIRALAAHLGLEGEAPGDYDKFDRRILEWFDIDFRRCGDLVTYRTGRNRRISESEYVDAYGIRYRFSGLYWEIVDGPLRGASREEMVAYELPTLADTDLRQFDLWAGRARALRERTPYVVVAEHPVLGVLELACWLCGYDHVMMLLALDPEIIHLFFERILAFQKRVIREYYGRLGPYIHLTTSGDDFGTQKGLFMSPKMWREFVKPYLKARIDYTAKFTDAVYMHHSCGGIYEIIPDLIEIGVRVLNPIQPAAAGMDASRLKAVYGGQIVFHGGLDTQEVLPSNDMARIDAEVGSLLDTMHPQQDGGYIFAAAHNLQNDVTPASIAQMYQAALKVQRPKQDSNLRPTA